jgi:hypothetical protein
MKKALLYILILSATGINAQNATPAVFPGGDSAWQYYLDTSFHLKEMAVKLLPKERERFGSMQTARYSFLILADGTIGSIIIEGQVSQIIRSEINRILQKSPRWTPATLNGQPSTYRKRQVSVFHFD